MSSIIKATPVLNKKESKRFLKKIEEGLKNPVGLVPTPKLEEVRKRIFKEYTGK